MPGTRRHVRTSEWIVRKALGAGLVVAVSLALAGCTDAGNDQTERISAAPELLQAGPVPTSADCARETLPFRASSLPDGWNHEVQTGELRDYKADRSYAAETTRSWRGSGEEAIGVYRDPPGIEPPKDDPAPIAVLGGRGVIGPSPRAEWSSSDDTPVTSAAFSWCGSRWALVGVGGVTLDQVRSVAEGLVPA